MDGENDGAQAAGSQDGLEPQEPQGYEAEAADKARPIVCFESFQDFLGRGRDGRIKPQHEWVREEDWDLVIFDEYHFGAWNENSKSLFEQEDEDERDTTEDVDTRRAREHGQRDRRGRPAHRDPVLPLPLGHALPGPQLRRVHRGADLQLDLLRRAVGQRGLALRAPPAN